MSHQPAFQLVGFEAILDPLRVQREVEPWSVSLVATAIIALASGDIDHAEDIGPTHIYTTTRKHPPQTNQSLYFFNCAKLNGNQQQTHTHQLTNILFSNLQTNYESNNP